MSIDNLTLGQLKEISDLFSNRRISAKPHPFIGKYVIARCGAAGVHAGTLVSAEGDSVILSGSRRLWHFKAAGGVALSGVANFGIKSGSKLDSPNEEIALFGVCELIPATTVAKELINVFKN